MKYISVVIPYLLLLSTLNFVHAESDLHNKRTTKYAKQNENRFIVVFDDDSMAKLSRHNKLNKQATKGVQVKQATKSLQSLRLQQAGKRRKFKQTLTKMQYNARFPKEFKELFNGVGVITKLNKHTLLQQESVKAVYPVNTYTLKLDAALEVVNAVPAWQVVGGRAEAGKNTKIAIIDSGIIPEHPMFADTGFSPASDLPNNDYCRTIDASFCNNKLIVARHYPPADYNFSANNEADSPRASRSHGVHVAAIATGREVITDNNETISGVAPGAYLMVYKALWGRNGTATDFELLDALDDAFADGADVINNSWGGSPGQHPINSLYQNIFNELENSGVVVVTAAGNEGDIGENTINCPACVEAGIAVAATTTSKVSGHVLSFDNQEIVSSPGDNYINGRTFSGTAVLAPSSNNLGCEPYPANSLTNRIVVVDRGVCFFADKASHAANAGASAMIIVNNVPGRNITMVMGTTNLLSTFISQQDGELLKQYVAATNTPQVSMAGQVTSNLATSAQDQLASFSSRGPNGDVSFLKPDLAAPGEAILSAVNSSEAGNGGQDYGILDGTSMASPMVAGAASVLKQLKPNLLATEIKRLLIGSADGGIASFHTRGFANGFETGAGRLNLDAALSLEVYADKPNLVLLNCDASCTLTSSLHSTTTDEHNWQGQLTFLDQEVIGSLSPATVTTADLDSQNSFTVTVNLPVEAEQDWYHGEILWSNGTGQTIRQAVVVENNNHNSELLAVNLTNLGDSQLIEVDVTNQTTSNLVEIQMNIAGEAEFDQDSYQVTSVIEQTGLQISDKETTVIADLSPPILTMAPTSPPVDIDLATSSSVVTLSCNNGCDEYTRNINFNFDYLGDSYSQLTVSDNGFAMVGTPAIGSANLATNRNFPDPLNPNNILAPFWLDFDHLDPQETADTGGGRLMFKRHSEGNTRYLIVQWNKVKVYVDAGLFTTQYWGISDANLEFTFQLIIEENTDNIWFNYLSIPEQPNFYSVGFENHDASFGFRQWFDDDIGNIAQVQSGDSFQLGYQPNETISFNIEAKLPTLLNFAKDDKLVLRGVTSGALNLLENDEKTIPDSILTASVGTKDLNALLFEGGESNLEPDSLAIITQPEMGTLTTLSDGNIHYRYNSNFTGTDSFTYQISNSFGQTSQADVEVLVEIPLSLTFIGNFTVGELMTTSITGKANDPIGEVNYTWSLPTGLTADSLTNESINITTPSVSAEQSFLISLTITDDTSEVTSQIEITVLNNNTPPSDIQISGSDTIIKGQTSTFVGSAQDTENDLSFSWQVSNGLQIQSTNSNEVTLLATNSNLTSATLTLTVSDGEFNESINKTISLEEAAEPEPTQTTNSRSSGGGGSIWWLIPLAGITLLRRYGELRSILSVMSLK